MARPSKWDKSMVAIAQVACRLGGTDKDVAEAMGVCERTLNNWKCKYPELAEVMTIGKDVADDRVERSLFQMAIGYEQEEVKIFMPAGATEPVYAPYTAKVAPSPTAAIFWLKNRRKDEWRDKREDDTPKDDMGDVIRDLIAKLPG